MSIKVHGPHRFERPDGNGGISVHYGIYAFAQHGKTVRRKLFDTQGPEATPAVQVAAQAWAEAEMESLQGR